MIDDILVFSKHSALSVVSPSLSVTISRLVQFLKAAPSIVVTDSGIVTDTIDVFLANAELPIAITAVSSIADGITTSFSVPV